MRVMDTFVVSLSTPELTLVTVVLFGLLLVPYLVYAQRRGKAVGHRSWNWWRPRGHGAIGADTGKGPGGRPVPHDPQEHERWLS